MPIRLNAIERLINRSPFLKSLADTILKAGEPGEKIAPGITRIRGNLCNVHGRYGPCDKDQMKRVNYNKPAAGAKGKKPKAGKAPKETPEQKAAKIDAARRSTLASAGFSPSETDLLDKLAKNGPTAAGDLSPGDIDAMKAKGLVEVGKDGSIRLSPAGRSVHTAAASGDAAKVREQLARTTDKVTAAGEKEAERDAKKAEAEAAKLAKTAERDKRKAEIEARRAAKKGGGGKTEKPATEAKPDKEEKPKNPPKTAEERTAEREAAAFATANKLAADLGLPEGTVEVLSAAAEGRATAGLPNNAYASIANPLVAAGLVTEGDSTETTEEGLRALRALKRGDRAGYQDAVRDAKERMAKEAAAKESSRPSPLDKGGDDDTTTTSGLRRRQKAAERRGRRLKESIGANPPRAPAAAPGLPRRWYAITTSAHQDRAKEFVGLDSLDKVVRQGQLGPLRFWHVLGLNLGDTDFQARMGRHGEFLFESGTFYGDTEAKAGLGMAKRGYQMSPGFDVTQVAKDDQGHFTAIEIFERSGTPSRRSMNPFTSFGVI